MSVNIPNHFSQQFATTVELLLQQKGSRLRGAVTERGYVGEQASPVDQIESIVANKVTGRFNPMQRVDADLPRRWVLPTSYDLPQLIDQFDKLKMLTQKESDYVQNAVFALGRAIDEEILTGMFGTNKTGKSGTNNTAFPTAQEVSVIQDAASATNLTVAKLIEAKRVLMAANVDMESEQFFCGVTATEHASLLQEVQAVSSDFNGGEAVLKNGKITSFMGFNFIHTELLSAATDDQAGTSTQCPAWAKSGVHLGVWGDIQSDISQRKDLQGIPFQAYVFGTFGATRIEEEKIVKIWCR